MDQIRLTEFARQAWRADLSMTCAQTFVVDATLSLDLAPAGVPTPLTTPWITVP